MITYTTALRNTAADSGVDAVFNSGKVQMWSGAAPGAGAAPTGTKLWEINLPADAFAAAVAGVKAKIGAWSAACIAAGVLGYLRIIAAGDTAAATQNEPRIEGAVTTTAVGTGDWQFDNTNVTVGQVVTIATSTMTVG